MKPTVALAFLGASGPLVLSQSYSCVETCDFEWPKGRA